MLIYLDHAYTAMVEEHQKDGRRSPSETSTPPSSKARSSGCAKDDDRVGDHGGPAADLMTPAPAPR